MSKYGDWEKESDGVWRHPRYPRGGDKQHSEVDAGYDQTTNGAWIEVKGERVLLTFGELGFLQGQLIRARQTAQKENSRLWQEKAAIIEAEERTA